MTTTQTTTSTSLSLGSTVLSAQEQQSPPVQSFRIGTHGEIVQIEAQWDGQLQQFCFRVSELQRILDVRVDRVRRAETGVFVCRLHYDGDSCPPYRYALSTGVLEVYTFGGPSPPRSNDEAYELSRIIEQFDRLFLLIQADFRSGQHSNTAEYQRAIEQHYPALDRYQSDAAKIEAVKVSDLFLYPVPRRFFVVLRNRNRFSYIRLRRPLQLHLLCESGIYNDEMDLALKESFVPSDGDGAFEATEDANGDGPARTHLSYHPGYCIDDPTNFCKDLASHLLPVLKFLHYSAVFAGIVVPALASINVSGWFTVAQSFVNYNNTSWSEPWLKTLEYVAGLGKLKPHLKKDEVDLTNDDIPRAIRHPQFRQYQSHLEELDPSKVYGNLIPTFCNRSGRLKYVCRDHDEDSMTAERDEDNSFCYLQTLGSAVVVNRAKGEATFTMDPKLTNQFCLYLMASPSIRKVSIHLGPGMTAAEFKVLKDGLERANIDNINLIATGTNTAGSYYNDVLELMVNHRCQSLTLDGFEEFYSRITCTKKPATTRLKALTLRCNLRESEWRKLETILKLCPALRILTISTAYSNTHYNRIHSKLPHLKRLEFSDSTHITVIRTSKDSREQIVYSTELNIKAHCEPSSLPKDIHSHLALLRLHWLPDPDGPLKAWLVETLRDNPRLLTFDLRVPLKHFLTWVTLLSENFETVDTFHGTLDSRRMVRLQSVEEDHDVTMTIKFIGQSLEFDIKVEMTGTLQSNPPLNALIRSHGSFIGSFVASQDFDDAMATAISESFHDRGSKLKLLNIDPSGLTDVQHLQDIMDRSPNIKEFTLSFSSLEKSDRQNLAKDCYRRYGNRVTGLLLRGSGQCSDWIINAIPLRSELTAIRDFKISFEKDRGQFRDEEQLSKVLQFISSPVSSPESATFVPPSFKPLQSISLSNCEPILAQWNDILFALNIGALKYLSVQDTNFGFQEMDWLIGRLPKPTAILMRDWSPPSLNELVIKDTALVKNMQRLAQLETKLLLRAPSIRVIID